MRRNFPGFPGLGMMFNGKDWKGPMNDSSASRVKGPMYRCFVNSLCSISSKALRCTKMEGLLSGVKEWVMVGARTWKPCISCSSRVGCLCNKSNSINRSRQLSAL
jgi:hypothetical protein